MSNEQKPQDQAQGAAQQDSPQGQQQAQAQGQQQAQQQAAAELDALARKKPEELTPDELRLLADTMPGDGPGD